MILFEPSMRIWRRDEGKSDANVNNLVEKGGWEG